jgi:competence protein ComEC
MRKKQTILFLLIFILLNFYSWNFLFSIYKEELEVTFFDVGQGDAIFIKTPQNHYILIDGGPDDVVLEKLEKKLPFYNRSIDLVVLTHPHYDHISGIIEVLERYKVKNILYTGVIGEGSIFSKWKELTKEEYRLARAGQRVSANDFSLIILYPAENLKNKEVEDLNEASIISRLVFGEKSFLFMGDAYIAQEKEIIRYKEDCEKEGREQCDVFEINSTVLKIGHHGSSSSSSENFLAEVNPKIAVIMVGENNKYGHPNEDVIERLKEKGIVIKRTDKDGDIIFNLSLE